ncbi:MAG TPA: TetR/AcrR family transcriptional regulator [Solirubrobacteraceae bacterium]|jgi:AcrR family transcriptional regulator|nr:TetR/AcrR family transcriptional regulator [Solirubrobacteraceae bacterium]
MAPRRGPDKSVNTHQQKGRKSTQRDRLLAGMVAGANKGGYLGATVSEVIAQAGVSRPTFYDYFADRDECFVACTEDVRSQLLGEVRSAVQTRPPEDALAAAIEALVAFAVAEPAQARFLMNEVLAGTAAALDVRDKGIAEIAQLIDRISGRASAEPIPDLPVAVAIGAIQRLLGSRLRRGERALGAALEDLLGWSQSYARPARASRWHTLTTAGAIAPSPFLPTTPARAPARLGRGRPRLPEEQVAENHRGRIMFATAQVIAERGYTAATIADITKLAGVDGRAFYRLFNDKQEVFDAIYEHGLQHTMATVARAYFAGDPWPERMWEALRVIAQSAQSNPAGTNLGLIAAYAVSPAAAQRAEDARATFTLFLQEGYRYEQQGGQPSALALEAIAASVFELVYRRARERASRDTARLLPHLAHLCLTPFMGVEDAELFIEEQLSDEQRKPPRRTAAKPKRAPVDKRARARGAQHIA